MWSWVELQHGCADLSGVDQLSRARLAWFGEQDEADALGGALLVALQRRERLVQVDRRIEVGGELVTTQDQFNFVAQLRRSGETQGRQETESDRLAVAVALVAARRLDRVA